MCDKLVKLFQNDMLRQSEVIFTKWGISYENFHFVYFSFLQSSITYLVRERKTKFVALKQMLPWDIIIFLTLSRGLELQKSHFILSDSNFETKWYNFFIFSSEHLILVHTSNHVAVNQERTFRIEDLFACNTMT